MISLHFSVSVAPFKFVPLKLIVEPDVNVDPKCKIKFPISYFAEGGRLGTSSPDMVNPLSKGHSQLMHTRIRYHFLADFHVTRRA